MWPTTIALSQFHVITVCSLSVRLPISRFPSWLKVALIPCVQCGIMTVWQLSKTRDLFVHIKTEGNVMSEHQSDCRFHPLSHLLVCESQEAFQAGVSCRRQSVSVPLQPDGLQPRAHRPLWHTHLWHDRHAHLRPHPWLQDGACWSVKTETVRAGRWQSTKIGGWRHNWRRSVLVSLIHRGCDCEYSINACVWLY